MTQDVSALRPFFETKRQNSGHFAKLRLSRFFVVPKKTTNFQDRSKFLKTQSLKITNLKAAFYFPCYLLKDCYIAKEPDLSPNRNYDRFGPFGQLQTRKPSIWDEFTSRISFFTFIRLVSGSFFVQIITKSHTIFIQKCTNIDL